MVLVISLSGIQGSGKKTIANHFIENHAFKYITYDNVIINKFDLSLSNNYILIDVKKLVQVKELQAKFGTSYHSFYIKRITHKSFNEIQPQFCDIIIDNTNDIETTFKKIDDILLNEIKN